MASDVVAARDDDLRLAVVFEDYGRGVGIRRLAPRVGWPLLPPRDLASSRVKGDQVGRIVRVHPVQDFDEELAVVEQGRGGVAPHQAEGSVLLLQVVVPQLFTGYVKGPESSPCP